MSFKINWPKFSDEFIEKAKEQVTVALNKGNKPAKIVDKIIIKDLNMGTVPPDLEILEIGDLAEERFRGIFKLTYGGDASVVLLTKVQANPLIEKDTMKTTVLGTQSRIMAANKPLVVPMELRISNLKLRGIVVLVIDKNRGVTLVFKNDPLEKVDVNSTFDNIPNIRRFLQKQIEEQLRKLFQDDLPQLIHNLSLLRFGQKDDGFSSPVDAATTETNQDDTSKMNPLNIPHHQKWIGNDPVDGLFSDFDNSNGHILYRSLTSSFALDVENTGLRALLESNNMSFEPGDQSIFSWFRGRDTLNEKLKEKTVIIAVPLTSSRAERKHPRSYSFTSAQSAPGFDGYSADGIHNTEDDDSVYSTKSAPIPNRPHFIKEPTPHPANRRHIPSSKYPASMARPTSPSEIPVTQNRVVLHPSDNPVTAHLATLLTSNHTFFPFTHTPQHFTYRSSPPPKHHTNKHQQHKPTHSRPSISTNATTANISTATTIYETNNSSPNPRDSHYMSQPPDYTITPHSASSPHKKKQGIRRMRVPTSTTSMRSASSTASYSSRSQKSTYSEKSDDSGSEVNLRGSMSESNIVGMKGENVAIEEKLEKRSGRAKSVGTKDLKI